MPPKSKNNPTNDVLKFLLDKNRPYSITNLVDEMHGEYSKTVLQKSVDQLVENGQITCKLFGKTTKLYFAKQEGKEVASKEELTQFDQLIDDLHDNLEDLQKKVKELRLKRDLLSSTRKLNDLKDFKIKLEIDVEKAEIKKNELIKSSEGITPEEASKSQKKFSEKCENWKNRKNKCYQILDTLGESAEKKRSELIN